MLKCRINKPYNFVWTLREEGHDVNWSERNLYLEMFSPSHKKEAIEFTSQNTDISFEYTPTEIGQYFLSAYVDKGTDTVNIIDTKFIEGVAWSFLQNNEDEDLTYQTITLSGNITDSTIDLRRYYTKDEIDFNFYTKEEIEAKKYLTGIPIEYVTESELNAKGFLNAIPSEYITETELAYKNYATKPELNVVNEKLDQYYTKTDIENKNYITSSYLDSNGYINAIPDNYITSEQLAAKGYLTAIPSEYITEDKLTAKGYLTAIPDEYITATELAYKNYATKTELYTINDKFNQYYTKTDVENKNYVTKSYLNNKGYLSSIPSNYVTDSQMQSAINSSQNNIQNTLLNYYNKEQVDSLFENIPQDEVDLSDYYTKYEVEVLIDRVNSKDIDLAGYYTKSEIDSKHFLTSIPSEYITETELAYKNYATKSELTGVSEIFNSYYTKTEIDDLLDDFSGSGGDQPDLSDYYTKTEIDNKGYITSIPSDYITETELETRISQIDIPDVDLSGKVDGEGVSKLKVITEAEYNNLTQIETNTLYILT